MTAYNRNIGLLLRGGKPLHDKIREALDEGKQLFVVAKPHQSNENSHSERIAQNWQRQRRHERALEVLRERGLL